MLELDKIYNMDCIEGMKLIDDKSIDMILCDLPYGSTGCSWDTIIPLDLLWEQYERITKKNSAIVLTASQPFTSRLVMSNLNLFKYELIWDKVHPSNPYLANYMPLKSHENILVFYKNSPKYNQIRIKNSESRKTKFVDNGKHLGELFGDNKKQYIYHNDGTSCPKSIITFMKDTVKNSNDKRKINSYHPTQKPLDLFVWLIYTYTDENDIVLDNCIGSGTTAIACKKINRHFIGFELEEDYVKISKNRLYNVPMKLENFQT